MELLSGLISAWSLRSPRVGIVPPTRMRFPRASHLGILSSTAPTKRIGYVVRTSRSVLAFPNRRRAAICILSFGTASLFTRLTAFQLAAGHTQPHFFSTLTTSLPPLPAGHTVSASPRSGDPRRRPPPFPANAPDLRQLAHCESTSDLLTRSPQLLDSQRFCPRAPANNVCRVQSLREHTTDACAAIRVHPRLRQFVRKRHSGRRRVRSSELAMSEASSIRASGASARQSTFAGAGLSSAETTDLCMAPGHHSTNGYSDNPSRGGQLLLTDNSHSTGDACRILDVRRNRTDERTLQRSTFACFASLDPPAPCPNMFCGLRPWSAVIE